jgi:hypothetical protein
VTTTLREANDRGNIHHHVNTERNTPDLKWPKVLNA